MKTQIAFALLGLIALSYGAVVTSDLADQLGLISPSVDPVLLEQFIENREVIGDWLSSLNDNHPYDTPRLPSLTCLGCRTAIGLALSLIHSGVPIETIFHDLEVLCTTLNIADETTCKGIVANYLPASAFIIREHEYLKTNDFCGMLIQDGTCGAPNASFTDWDIELDKNKPPVVTRPLLPANRARVQVLQLTDIHMDLHYVRGARADCDGFLCCRDPVRENTTDQSAGRFGDYNCDFPEDSVQNLFEDAASRYNYSFVLLTGDYVHHAIWATNVADNKAHNNRVAEILNNLFNTTTVFPVVGNHEPHPCNMYPPRSVWGEEEFDLSWMFNQIGDLYSNHLPKEAVDSFRNYGYYHVSPSPGFRVVVLNTNLCYTLNFWLYYNMVDPEDQLQWFADVMLEAEQAGEIVYVVGHIPPGHYQCWSKWAGKFDEIINRFEGIIQAQFYGHTHEDDLKIFFEGTGNASRPTNSLYIGASATTYTDLNPGYKVYHVDGAESTVDRTWEIIDHETWIYNLTLSNLEGNQPAWYKLYSAKEAYGLESLRPSALYDLVVRMVNDEALFATWYNHYNKAADTMEHCISRSCRLEKLCDIVTADYGDQSHCKRLESL